MKTTTLVERIIARLTGNDDKGKIQRFHKRLVKQIDNSIVVAKSKLDDLEAKLEDAKEQLTDAIEVIVIDRLDTVESIDAYIVDYNRVISNAEQKVFKLEQEIKEVQEQITAGEKRKVTVL